LSCAAAAVAAAAAAAAAAQPRLLRPELDETSACQLPRAHRQAAPTARRARTCLPALSWPSGHRCTLWLLVLVSRKSPPREAQMEVTGSLSLMVASCRSDSRMTCGDRAAQREAAARPEGAQRRWLVRG
jgi:hypothetical protein